MDIVINVDDKIASEAQSVFEALGLDMETAVRMFLKRAVIEQGLPMSTSISSATSEQNVLTAKKRTNNVITRPMVEDIWKRFLHYIDENGDINATAADAHQATGMNQGSAFIYLTILDNFISGKHNTRNMKMADLRYYVEKIHEELDEQSYLNTLKSLKSSIPYWDKDAFGLFASKVQTFVDELES